MVADPGKRHRWNVHPTMHIRRTEMFTFGILILTVLILFSIWTFKDYFYGAVERWKANYTQIHYDVEQLKIWSKKHKGGHK